MRGKKFSHTSVEHFEFHENRSRQGRDFVTVQT